MSRPEPDKWDVEAKQLLQAQLKRRSISFKELSRLMAASEGDDAINPAALANRINRGTFTLGFALRVLRAIGAETLDVRALSGKGRD